MGRHYQLQWGLSMAKVYIVTEAQMQARKERLELAHMRKSNVLRHDDPRAFEDNDLFRAFNFVVCRWIQEVGNE